MSKTGTGTSYEPVRPGPSVRSFVVLVLSRSRFFPVFETGPSNTSPSISTRRSSAKFPPAQPAPQTPPPAATKPTEAHATAPSPPADVEMEQDTPPTIIPEMTSPNPFAPISPFFSNPELTPSHIHRTAAPSAPSISTLHAGLNASVHAPKPTEPGNRFPSLRLNLRLNRGTKGSASDKDDHDSVDGDGLASPAPDVTMTPAPAQPQPPPTPVSAASQARDRLRSHTTAQQSTSNPPNAPQARSPQYTTSFLKRLSNY
ncbi:hypothetical protein BV25DRAFT_1912150 [Artomyces pyxidatus]|uniref:Uncharacterized protein n=1 Tax=Artomyces pyxidatus TaxID=48021 RepID=A0ACB8TGJ2_9AGAM|nr:hypothetical protein BV25DRAFT_1912150 [Artomyces pyxidatus]